MYKLVIENENGQYELVKNLSNIDVQLLNEELIHIYNFEEEFSLYFITLLNYDELHQAIEGYSSTFNQNNNRSVAYNIMMDLNRKLLNYLSSARTFVDHMQTSLTRKFGQDSEELQSFKNATSSEYENSFSYRFLYKLRNYAQHCGMPISHISGHYVYDTETQKTSDESVLIHFSRDNLLKNFDKWSIVKDELLAMESDIIINPYIKEFHNSLTRINGSIIQSKLLILQNSITVIQSILSEIQNERVPVYIGNFNNVDESIQNSIKLTELPLATINNIKEIM